MPSHPMSPMSAAPESLEEMLKQAEEGSQGNENRSPALDNRFIRELVASVRAALSPSLREGELPPLEVTDEDRKADISMYPPSHHLYRKTPVSDLVKLACRERQLRASIADVSRLKEIGTELASEANLWRDRALESESALATAKECIADWELREHEACGDRTFEGVMDDIRSDVSAAEHRARTAHVSGKLEGRKEALEAVRHLHKNSGNSSYHDVLRDAEEAK